MSTTPILNINEVAENQNNKYITINNAINALAAATNAVFSSLAIGAGPLNLSDAQATRNMLYNVSSGSANFDVVMPAVINGNNTKRTFIVANKDPTYTATVKASSGSGSTVVILPGATALIAQDYQTMSLILTGSTIAAVRPYDVGLFVPGVTTNAQLVARIVVARACIFPDNYAGSRAAVVTPPASSAVFEFSKNGTVVGSLTISTLGVATFSTIGTTVSYSAGDTLEITSQATADVNMADISISLLGERT